MADATGTLAGLNEFLSDTPTDVDVIELRVTLIATAISTIAGELDDKLRQTPGPIRDKKLVEQTMAQLELLKRELDRLLKIKRRLESAQRRRAFVRRLGSLFGKES